MVFYKELGDTRSRALCMQHIGSVKAKQGNYEEGMLMVEESLKIRAEGGDKLGIADGLQVMSPQTINPEYANRCKPSALNPQPSTLNSQPQTCVRRKLA
jgi:hypothetical protein